MTYLEMCQKLRRECGVQGSGPSAVTGQTGILQKLVDWIADADEEIQAMWFDWDFLWTQYSTSTIIGTANYTKPSDHGIWDTDSFFLDYTSDSYRKLDEMPYKVWRTSLRNGTKTNNKPSHFIIKPDNNLVLETPPDAVYTLTADYWKTATRLSANTSESNIPTRFQRIIIARAKMYFAEHENAPEIMQGAVAEYRFIKDNLEADQLPGQENRRRSEGKPMTVVTE